MREGEVRVLYVGSEEAGLRLDQALALALEDSSRSYLQKLIAQGRVRIDGEVCSSKKEAVKEGQEIRLLLPPVRELDLAPENIPLDIVYEDEDLLVVDKPRGMVVHPAPGNEEGTLVNALLYHCGERLSTINGTRRPGIVHRIDKDTSGLLMVAKNDRAHRSLAEQLEAHSIRRCYRALVWNNFSEEEGSVDVPLSRDPRQRTRQAAGDPRGRRALTHYRVLERFGRYTLIEARLETGRTHQIRVHMAYIHHPLVGDQVYGSGKNPFGVKGQMLHAGELGFVHPSTGQEMLFTSPLPDYFEKVLGRLRQD